MILKTSRGNRELFAAFDSSVPIPRPSMHGGAVSYGGRRVSLEDASGLPAFMRAVRLISETVAMMPFVAAWQGRPRPEAAGVLRRPLDGVSPFTVWSYTVAAMLRGNAYLWKIPVRGRVVGLQPIDPCLVEPDYDDGEPRFKIRRRENGPVWMNAGTSRVIHLPGILLGHPFVGVSVIEAHRNGLGAYLDRQEFEARYLANDGSPGVVLKNPSNTTAQQRAELRESFEARHGGPSRAGRPAFLWGGWDIDRVGVSLSDAQFIETSRFQVQEVGRMLGVPSGLLGEPSSTNIEAVAEENTRFLTYGLAPWMTRLEQGLLADPDLFDGPDWDLQLDPGRLLRADDKTRFDGYRLARQGGWITANEIRALEGREPVEGGDEIQKTPVGGAPNAGQPDPTETPTENEKVT